MTQTDRQLSMLDEYMDCVGEGFTCYGEFTRYNELTRQQKSDMRTQEQSTSHLIQQMRVKDQKSR